MIFEIAHNQLMREGHYKILSLVRREHLATRQKSIRDGFIDIKQFFTSARIAIFGAIALDKDFTGLLQAEQLEHRTTVDIQAFSSIIIPCLLRVIITGSR